MPTLRIIDVSEETPDNKEVPSSGSVSVSSGKRQQPKQPSQAAQSDGVSKKSTQSQESKQEGPNTSDYPDTNKWKQSSTDFSSGAACTYKPSPYFTEGRPNHGYYNDTFRFHYNDIAHQCSGNYHRSRQQLSQQPPYMIHDWRGDHYPYHSSSNHGSYRPPHYCNQQESDYYYSAYPLYNYYGSRPVAPMMPPQHHYYPIHFQKNLIQQPTYEHQFKENVKAEKKCSNNFNVLSDLEDVDLSVPWLPPKSTKQSQINTRKSHSNRKTKPHKRKQGKSLGMTSEVIGAKKGRTDHLKAVSFNSFHFS